MAKDYRGLAEEVAQGVLLDEPDFLKEIVEKVLQELLEAEMTEHIGAAPYERTAERKGHRNGHKPRSLMTRVGIMNLLVPQDLKKGRSERTEIMNQSRQAAALIGGLFASKRLGLKKITACMRRVNRRAVASR